MIKIKRVYEKPDIGDGIRILVDRLWPRGISKEKAKIDYWMKEIAPTNGLRKWFGHREERWEEFRSRYFKELGGKGGLIEELKALSKNKTLTFLYGAKDAARNNAAALSEYLREK